jgi:sensor histidine kinase regulating citrate/malate metabolism
LIDALEETHNKKETLDVPLTITIRTQAINSDWVSIQIADNGCGMSKDCSQTLHYKRQNWKPPNSWVLYAADDLSSAIFPSIL